MSEASELNGTNGTQLNKDYLHSESKEFLTVRDEVLKEFAEIEKALVKRKDLVLRLGKAIETPGKGVKREDICSWIKHYLKDAIEKELISPRDIERYCPDEWKNTIKSQARKGVRQLSDEKLSSKPEEKTIIIATDGTQEPTIEHPKSILLNISPQPQQTVDSKPNEELEKQLANLANQIAQKTAENQAIKTELEVKTKDVEELTNQVRELQEITANTSFKSASELVENPQELKKRNIEQAKLLLPFETQVEFEIRGQLIPLVVKVQPANKSVIVRLDEVAAKRMSQA